MGQVDFSTAKSTQYLATRECAAPRASRIQFAIGQIVAKARCPDSLAPADECKPSHCPRQSQVLAIWNFVIAKKTAKVQRMTFGKAFAGDPDAHDVEPR